MADLFIDVGIFYVKVVVAGFDVVDGHIPGLLVFNSGFKAFGFTAPPVDFRLEFFKANRLGLVVAFYAFGIRVFIIPDMLSRFSLGKKPIDWS